MLEVLEGFYHQVARNFQEIHIGVLEIEGGNGHQWKKTWMWQGCEPSNNTFRGESPPLRRTFLTSPYMNYERGRKICRDPADS